jgi:hypothetical protein
VGTGLGLEDGAAVAGVLVLGVETVGCVEKLTPAHSPEVIGLRLLVFPSAEAVGAAISPIVKVVVTAAVSKRTIGVL